MQKETIVQQRTKDTKTVEMKDFKALLCQLNPFHKNAKNTIDRVLRSLNKYDKKSQIDIIMFPEMSFIGYNFSNAQDALPYGNFQMQGQQFQFTIQLAQRLNSYVGFGYIQKALKQSSQDKKDIVLYNSVAILDRKGKLLCNYRKSHLFYNDELWAQEGSGFVTVELKNTKGKVFKCAPAICMDINPKNFTSGQYELADFIVQQNVQIMLMFTNWVDSQKLNIQKQDVMATYNYWLHRLRPLINLPKQRLLLFCDRAGYEDDVFAKKKIQFYGSSCAIMLNPTYIIKNLGIQNEGYLLIETKMAIVEQNNQSNKKDISQ